MNYLQIVLGKVSPITYTIAEVNEPSDYIIKYTQPIYNTSIGVWSKAVINNIEESEYENYLKELEKKGRNGPGAGEAANTGGTNFVIIASIVALASLSGFVATFKYG